ncbi:MAG TPA: hypothetical protein VD997_15615 [Phycisphaerales bacterium]|nr:hypothetical protein [Phycisphaerales bacterium]
MTPTSAVPFVFASLPRSMPQGYGAAPLTEAEQQARVRLCAVVKSGAKAGESPLVTLRDTLDARVYLGCLCDSAGIVHEWLELWVQDTAGLASALPGYRQALSNAQLDHRWAVRAEGFAKVEGAGVIATGWETENPAPMFVDVKRLAPVAAKDRRAGASWQLCRDEGLLTRKGVPAYGATLSRHLYQPELGEETPLLPLDVVGADVSAMGVGATGEVAAVNGGGGRMIVRPYAPLAYEQFIDALTGVEGESGAADKLLKLIAESAIGGPAGAVGGMGKVGGWLNLSAAGTPARVVEALHLKLMVLAGAAAAVRSTLAGTQMPLLNLTGQSFRVRLSPGAGALPLWWTARVELSEPGEGVELPIEGTQAKYFLAASGQRMSVYTPEAVGRTASGKGWLRLRNVISESNGVILEGTLSTQDRLAPGKNDLVWLRFAVGNTRVDLYATVDGREAMAGGELKVRTVPHALSEDVTARLKSAMGVPIQDVAFELVPMMSSPCDLYAVGVLGARTLLTGPGRALPAVLDDLFSLAAEAAKLAETGEDLPGRLMRVFESDKKWAAALGPQRVLAGVSDADEAFLAVPPRLWFGTLAAVIRMFTGLSADSRCKDLGDAPVGGIHRVFDGVLDDLYALLTSCRSLIVSDPGLSADIREVVKGCIAAAKR